MQPVQGNKRATVNPTYVGLIPTVGQEYEILLFLLSQSGNEAKRVRWRTQHAVP